MLAVADKQGGPGDAPGAYLSPGGTWTNSCSREKKENFTDLNRQELLDKIASLQITRWNYRSPEDVAKLMQNLADHNFNMAVFQVRGNGTVFYKSKYEKLLADGYQ